MYFWPVVSLEPGVRLGLSYENSEEGEPRQLTSGASEASQFSPRNPDEILFLRGHRELAILTLSTGRVRELPGYHEGSFLLDYPSFSPGWERVYFLASRKRGDIDVLEGD
jgi:hypothetical protein